MSQETVHQPSDSLYCPHFRKKDESYLRELFSRVAAVRAENPDLFWFTHRPIDLFQTAGGIGGPSLESGDERIVTEDDVFDEFSADRIKNFAVVIEGEVGTGKSELCVALMHRLREEANRPLLRVDKDTDLMSMLTQDIPEFYERHFDEPLETSSQFKRLEEDINERPRMVASNAVSTAILEIGWDGYETDTTQDQEERIVEFVAERIRKRLVESGDYGEDPNLVTEQEYEQNSFLQVFEQEFEAFDVHPAEKLSNGFWQALLDQYDTPPLNDLFEQVGQKFQEEYGDVRPVAIFEDFSITGMQARQLRKYMERDNENDNWDFIIAGTRDSTEVLHKRTAEDRFRFYRTNKQNSNQVLFLDEDTAVDFVRPYLGYIKHDDDSIWYDRDTDSGEFTLRGPEPGSRCDECGLCSDAFRDLFPFNTTFIRRIYTGLNPSEQSPRELIIVVFETLLEYFNGDVRCPAKASPLEQVTNRIAAHDDVYREAEIFAHLAKWYGDTERYDDYIAVDRRFGQAFGLLEDDDETGDHGASIEVTDTEIKVPGVGFETRDTTSVTDEEPDDDEPDDTDSTEDDEPSISRVERIINEQMGYVDNWYTDPDDDAYVETDTYLRAAFTALIETLTQDYTLWTDCDLRYNLSTSDHPFVYPTSTTTPSVDQVVLDPQDFQRSDIRELLRYGVRLEEDRSSADRDRILDLVGTHMTTYARRWRAKLRATYLEDSTVHYKYNPPYGFDDFVLASYSWVVLLDDPWNELTAATVNDRFGSNEAYTLDPTLHTALQEELAPEAREYMEEFIDYADAFEKLVAERFGVSDSILDVPRLRQWLDRQSPYDVLSRLRADPEDLSFRVRFDTDTKLEDMVTLAYRVQKSLDEEEDEVRDYTTAETVLDALAGTDMEAVETKVDLLENYSVDRSLYESLMQFASYTQQDVDTVVAASKLCNDTLGRSTQEMIHKMLVEYKLSEADLVEAFTAIDFEADQSSTSFASRFQEVSDYYAGDE